MSSVRAAALAGGACAAALAVLGTALLPAEPTTPSLHGGHQMAAELGGGSASTALRPSTVLRQLACEPLRDVPGKAVTTMLVHFPPRAYTPAHRHPGSVTAYVLSGTVRSQLSDGAPHTYRAGDVWFEPPGVLHVFAENPSNEPADVLATFIAPEDCGPLTIFEP